MIGSDVWGPIVVAISVLWIGDRIEDTLRAMETDRREDSRQMIEALEAIRSDVDSIRSDLNRIELHFNPLPIY